jgi:hypothetical protein
LSSFSILAFCFCFLRGSLEGVPDTVDFAASFILTALYLVGVGFIFKRRSIYFMNMVSLMCLGAGNAELKCNKYLCYWYFTSALVAMLFG